MLETIHSVCDHEIQLTIVITISATKLLILCTQHLYSLKKRDLIQFLSKIVNDTPFTITFTQESDGGIKKKSHEHSLDTVVSLKSSEYFGFDDLIGFPRVERHCNDIFSEGENEEFKITRIKSQAR